MAAYEELDGLYTPGILEDWVMSLLPDPLDTGAPDLQEAEVIRVDRYGTVVAATDDLVYKGNASGDTHLCSIGIEEQYEAMVGLHAIAPAHVPAVHAAYRDDSGTVRAYTMDRAPGKPAGAYFTSDREPRALAGLSDLDIPVIADTLHAILDDITAAGWAHGDINPGNISLEAPATVSIYDPEFTPSSFRERSVDAVRERDRDRVEALIDALATADELGPVEN